MTDNNPQMPDLNNELDPLGILELILLSGAFPEPTHADAPAPRGVPHRRRVITPAEASPHDTEGGEARETGR